VVIAKKDHARLYFRGRQITPMLVAVDPEQSVHRSYRVPYLEILSSDNSRKPQWPYSTTAEQLRGVEIDPTGELGRPQPIPEGREELNKRDAFELTPEERVMRAKGHQLVGLFLIDREGVIRWRWVEAMESPEDIGRFPTASQVLTAAEALVSPGPRERRSEHAR